MGKKIRQILPALIISVVLSGAVFAAFEFELFEGVERSMFDLRLRIRGELPHGGQVVIADIDDYSLDPGRVGRWPFPRAYQAFLIDSLNRYGSKVIGYDVFFPEPEDTVPLRGIRDFMRYNFEDMGLAEPNLGKKGRNKFLRNLDEFYSVLLGANYADIPPDEVVDDPVDQNLNPDKIFANSLGSHNNVILGYFFDLPQHHKTESNYDQTYKTLISDFKDAGLPVPEDAKRDYNRIKELFRQLKKDKKTLVPIAERLKKVNKTTSDFEQSMYDVLERESGLSLKAHSSLEKFYRDGQNVLRGDLEISFRKMIENPDEDALEDIEDDVWGMENSFISTQAPENSVNSFFKAKDLTPNIKTFVEKTPHFGHVSVEPDPDGVIRYIMAAVSYGGYLFPALAIKTIALYKEEPITAVFTQPGEPPILKIGEQEILLDLKGELLVNYHGAKPYPRYSIYDILRPYIAVPEYDSIDPFFQEAFGHSAADHFMELYGQEPDEDEIWEMINTEFHEDVPLINIIVDWESEVFFEEKYGVSPYEAFENKIVLVGATAIGVYDLRVTPFSENSPGVEIHAQVIDSILSDSFITRPSEGEIYGIALIVGLAIILGILIPLRSPLGGAAIVLALGLGLGVVDYFYFFLGKGWWMPLSYPAIQMGVVFFAVTIYKYATEEREKRFIKDTFGRYLAPSVVEQLTNNPELIQLGGRSEEMTAFFSDIQGFSTISEKLGDPQRLVELLNDYLSEMAHVIESYEGTIDKYEGDAIIGFWGAPIHFPDHAVKACFACLDQQEKLKELREKWSLEGKWPEIVHNARVRMGLNTGEMVVGNMGSAGRMNYTIMGDSVNLAARLEGANKPYGTWIMISEYTYAQAKDFVEVRMLDSLRVVGKTEPVLVYELLARKGQVSPHMKRVLEVYNQGLEAYKKKDWDTGIARFTEALNIDPNDGPSKTYLSRCEEFKLEPPPAEWDGVYTMETK